MRIGAEDKEKRTGMVGTRVRMKVERGGDVVAMGITRVRTCDKGKYRERNE